MSKKDLKFEEIIQNIRSPTERIKESIYKYYWGYLAGVASRYISDESLISEVVNDSFMKAFQKMPGFVHNDSVPDFQKTFKAWLAKITANTAVDRIRNKKMLVLVEELPTDKAENFIGAVDKLNVADILKLFTKLPDMYRSIFNLYELEGFSHAEIAKLLGIPESSSRVYLTRAKQKLREQYVISMKISHER